MPIGRDAGTDAKQGAKHQRKRTKNKSKIKKIAKVCGGKGAANREGWVAPRVKTRTLIDEHSFPVSNDPIT